MRAGRRRVSLQRGTSLRACGSAAQLRVAPNVQVIAHLRIQLLRSAGFSPSFAVGMTLTRPVFCFSLVTVIITVRRATSGIGPQGRGVCVPKEHAFRILATACVLITAEVTQILQDCTVRRGRRCKSSQVLPTPDWESVRS
jgi:hypothetical protein